MLVKHGADLNLANDLEETPLLHAVCSGKLEIVRALVANRAEVDKTDVYGRSPLYFAAQKGHKKIVEILLDAGANPNMQDQRGRTVLSRAVCWGNYDIVRVTFKSWRENFGCRYFRRSFVSTNKNRGVVGEQNEFK